MGHAGTSWYSPMFHVAVDIAFVPNIDFLKIMLAGLIIVNMTNRFYTNNCWYVLPTR